MSRDNYGIPTLQKNGVTYSSDVDKAEVLNKHFAQFSIHKGSWCYCTKPRS